jgi:transcriptional regulator with XRE-family HTH domain
MNKLIEDIKKVQNLKGLSDAELSRLIGVDASTWSKIKNGKSSPGGRFLRGLTRNFPELRLTVYEFMGS